MAYLELLQQKCDRCRKSRVKYALRNRYNEAMGKFCERCGQKRKAELNAVEALPSTWPSNPPQLVRG